MKIKLKKEKTLLGRIYAANLLPNFIAVIINALYALGFISLGAKALGASLLIIGIVYVSIQFIIEPLVNFLITKKTSDLIRFWGKHNMNMKQKTELVKSIMSIPRNKCIETFVFFTIASSLASILLFKFLHFDKYIVNYFICAGIVASYVATIMTHNFDERICSEYSKQIISEGISNDEVHKKKFFGLSMTTLFIMYLVVPIIMTASLAYLVTRMGYTYITVHDNGYIAALELNSLEKRGVFIRTLPTGQLQLRRMIYVCITNISIISWMGIIYFKRIEFFTNQMRDALSAVNPQNIDDNKLFAVDLSSELSYSTYLINQTIVMFHNLIGQTQELNQQITQSIADLSSIGEETASTALTQSSSIKEILVTMEDTMNSSRSIETKIKEVNNVADVTSKDVDFGFENLQKNLSKMQEITLSNNTTINGIQTLNNKIISVKEIVNLINSVADNTKIIAFNAELEASNVDNEDFKFKNVADEIRKLADDTMSLTSQIKDQITNIEEASSNLIKTGQSCTEKIEEGNKLTEALKDKFLNVKVSAQNTAEFSKQIQSSISQQNEAFTALIQRLQQISSSVENFTESTKALGDSVMKLKEESAHLKQINTVR